MSELVNAIISGYVGKPKPNPFKEGVDQYSVKIGLDDGSEGWVNADVGTREADLLETLETGDALQVLKGKTKTGKDRYNIIVTPATLVASPPFPVAALPLTPIFPPPGGKKTWEDKMERAFERYTLVLDAAVILVTSVAMESELDLTDAQVFENARAIATHINIDL